MQEAFECPTSCFLLQVSAAEEPVGSILVDRIVGGRLAELASAAEEGALRPASRGRSVLDGLLGFHQVDQDSQNHSSVYQCLKYIVTIKEFYWHLLYEF